MMNRERPIRLLLVDDDELSRELLTLQIAAQGYHVESVESGDAALRHLRQTPKPEFDVVLTDLQMPGLSGPELIRELRAVVDTTTSANLVLLAMSASQPEDSLVAAFHGFLLKPFTMNQLDAAIRSPETAKSADAPTPAADSASSLDEAIYQSLASSMPAAQLQQLYTLCLDDAALRIARMRVSATAGDDVAYRREAHAIKGGCSMLGAVELHRLAAKAEDLVTDTANHVASLDEMMIAWERLRRILNAREDRPVK